MTKAFNELVEECLANPYQVLGEGLLEYVKQHDFKTNIWDS